MQAEMERENQAQDALPIAGLSDALPKTKVAIMVTKRCRTCRFSEMEGKDRVCRYDPPKMQFIPIPTQQRIAGPNGQPMTVQGVEVRTVSGWPPVQNDAWCRLWELKKPE